MCHEHQLHLGAPIFALSHYGIEADYRTVIPALLTEIRRRKT